MISRLIPKFMDYSWGDLRFIQELCDLHASKGTPVAEMWMGAHPKASSDVIVNHQPMPLCDVIANDPEKNLGDALDLHAGQLPFLFKVLATSKPLSIQLHPDKAAALMGYEEENKRKVAIDDPCRMFKDTNHKPEILIALSPFSLLCGFRPYTEIAELLTYFGLHGTWLSARTFIDDPQADALHALFPSVLQTPRKQIKDILLTNIRIRKNTTESILQVHDACHYLQQHHPDDAGVLAPIFLNILNLNPSQGVFVPPGTLHSYIQGAGLELMANSDNVIRGGLTDKHIDLDALAHLADFAPFQPEILMAIHHDLQGNDFYRYPVPVQDFNLGILELKDPLVMSIGGIPHIMLVLDGKVILNSSVQLSKGEAAYLSASETNLMLSGKASLAMVSAGSPANL